MRDFTYPSIITFGKVMFRLLGLRFQRSGTEHVPREGGALLAINHIGYVDFVLAGYAAVPAGRVVRFMAKKEIFDHSVAGPVMRSMHHIPVDRSDGAGSFRDAVRYLREGELVGIFPEATISRSFEVKELKSGATRIAAEAGVPLLPVVLWGTQRLMTKDHPRDLAGRKTIGILVGEPMHPTGDDPAAETAALHEAMSALVREAIEAYPADEQPEGSWWLPASYGGSAPTPAEAEELDAAEKRRRAERRRKN
ncbi:1-acyl-sn-glycerol-3-phosphate acyltransferase [Marmoricola endophyticus]|uniref:1-acyl-sn-glycerol-3-phosphate acyltransferase n=1 Tax=Marmoricola endophyticus TaxID=2040280 RepID=A0A917BIQ7_9ACTN|nr:lysophospholipid acyltransferase family protein [Marmoricola endophyticus]GGF47236.1 1-acyl-sn-glycerol-3-phosphate acyltransferase [Marmoricola endophyticus]